MDGLLKVRDVAALLGVHRQSVYKLAESGKIPHYKVRGALKRAGLADKGYCFHDIRRTFASILHANDVPLLTISKLLGHRSVKTTERYLNVKLEEKRQVVDILGDALGLNPDRLLPTVNVRSKEIEAAPVIDVLPA